LAAPEHQEPEGWVSIGRARPRSYSSSAGQVYGFRKTLIRYGKDTRMSESLSSMISSRLTNEVSQPGSVPQTSPLIEDSIHGSGSQYRICVLEVLELAEAHEILGFTSLSL
jgi:hypothetical protein